MQLSATHTTNTQLFSQFLPFFNIPELKFADLRLFWFLRISREFSRNFTSRSRSRGIFTSLFILEKSEPDFRFTFHFPGKVNKISISLFSQHKAVLDCSRMHQTVPGSTRMYQALPGCTWLDLAVPGCIWLFQTVLGCTRLYKAVSGCTWWYQAVPGYTWLFQAALGCRRLY